MIIKNKNVINAVDIIRTVITSFLIFNIAMLFPLTSFIFPIYKIRANKRFDKKEILIINVSLFILITLVSKLTLMFYVSLFLVIETFYYFFERLRIKVKTFDRIIITTLISTVLLMFFLRFAGDTLELLKTTINDIYINQYGVSKRDVNIIFSYMEKYKVFLLYIYIGIIVYFTHFILDKDKYKNWKISYQWIILYIVAFFINKYANFGKVLSLNIMAMVKMTYALYGVKLIYKLINSKLNNVIISQIGALLLGFYFSGFAFIIGALECFDFIKIHVIKLNNNGGRK